MAHVDANVVQQSFRVRNDDGSETAATWKAPLNGDVGQSLDEAFRIRFVVEETAGGSANNNSYVLQYSLNGGSWTLADLTTPVHATPSAFVSDATPTTQQLGAGAFVAGEFDSDAGASNITLSSQQTEMEYCLTLDSAQVSFGDTIQLRVTAGGIALNGYTNTPTISVAVIGAIDATLEGTAAAIVASVDIVGNISATLEGTSAALNIYHPGPEYVEPYYSEAYYVVTGEPEVQIPTADISAALEGVDAAFAFEVEQELAGAPSTQATLSSTGAIQTGDGWIVISGSVTVLAGEDGEDCRPMFRVNIGSAGGWYVDNVSVKLDGIEQATNGDLETGDKTGWDGSDQSGVVVLDGGNYVLDIAADSSLVQDQDITRFGVTVGQVIEASAWVKQYGDIEYGSSIELAGVFLTADTGAFIRYDILHEEYPDVPLAGNNVTVSALSSAGAIAQTHELTGAGATQAGASTAGAIAQTHELTGAGATQAGASTAGAIVQTHELAGAGATQAGASTAGAIVQTHELAGAGATVGAVSSTGAISSEGDLAGAPSTQATSSSTGAIVQTHELAGAGATAGAVSSTGAISSEGDLAGAATTVGAISSTGSIIQTHLLAANDAIIIPLSSVGALLSDGDAEGRAADYINSRNFATFKDNRNFATLEDSRNFAQLSR